MANYRYFADLNGETVELRNIRHDGSIYTSAKHFSGTAPDGSLIATTRMVQYKSNPSRHACDARCIHAKGRVMNCECSCGGKNHGRGY